MYNVIFLASYGCENRERKCADIIGTVPVPWAGHFQWKDINNYIFQIKYTDVILSNSTRKLLRSEITKMMISL